MTESWNAHYPAATTRWPEDRAAPAVITSSEFVRSQPGIPERQSPQGKTDSAPQVTREDAAAVRLAAYHFAENGRSYQAGELLNLFSRMEASLNAAATKEPK
jgi:hypothetical protein